MIVIFISSLAANATPDEIETLEQAYAIRDALKELGYASVIVPFTLDLAKMRQVIKEYNPKLAFNLVETIDDRSNLIHWVPSWLEYLGIPCTGGGGKSLFMTTDKLMTKNFFRLVGIPTPPAIADPLKLLRADFPKDGPYFVKSVIEEGSFGLGQDCLVHDYDNLMKIFEGRVKKYGGRWFAERYIGGREFNISVLAGPNGPEVLPIVELQFIDLSPGQIPIVDYAAKWIPESELYQKTQRSFDFPPEDESLLIKLRELALTCWKEFDALGYIRVDVRVDADGEPWVLEVNVNPSLAPGLKPGEEAGFVAAARKAGLDYIDIVDRIIKDVELNPPIKSIT